MLTVMAVSCRCHSVFLSFILSFFLSGYAAHKHDFREVHVKASDDTTVVRREKSSSASQQTKTDDDEVIRAGRKVCGKGVTSKEPGRWHGDLSVDGARGQRLTYDLDACQLRRYTAVEARQCLKGRHLVMVGDSLMRYQYLSLVHFLHFNSYPQPGNPESEKDKPNICMEGDFIHKISTEWRKQYGLNETTSGWDAFFPAVSQMLQGTERCDCFRTKERHIENRFYKDPVANVGLTYILKTKPDISGNYPFARGHAQPPSILTEEGYQAWGGSAPATWNASNIDFVTRVLPEIEKDMGNVTDLIWNEGIWLTEKDWMPLMREARKFLDKRNGRAFWKGTTRQGYMSLREFADWERYDVTAEAAAEQEGWEMLDVKQITKKITIVRQEKPDDWTKDVNTFFPTHDGLHQVQPAATHWDMAHFKPWVYEEMNNLWLNMLCN